MIEHILKIAKTPFYLSTKTAEKILPFRIKNSIFRSPIYEMYSKNYLRLKLMSCKIENKFNIVPQDMEVHWISTYDCNFRCKHCEASAGEKHVSELSTDEICSLITELSDMNIKKICIGGGECLLRKDIFVVIEHILKMGMEYEIESNSYLIPNFKKEFENMRPHTYFTSIDGLEKTNDEIRKIGSFKKTLQALDFFKSIGVKTRIVNTIVIPDNIGQLVELREIIMNSSATFWRFAIPINSGRAKDDEKLSLNNEQIKYLFNFIEESRKKFAVGISEDAGYLGNSSMKLRSAPFFCGAGLTRCTVLPDGEVLGCQLDYDNKYSEGNIRNKSFKEIWKTGFSRFRDPKLEQEEECLQCKHYDSCHGGCPGMRIGNRHCYKDIWEKEIC
jgi:radical SAM protein with 4Fe4S-binding SPASM domain